MVEVFIAAFSAVRDSFRKTFNTATVRFAVSAQFQPVPLKSSELERFLSGGFKLPDVDVPEAILPFAQSWWTELREELEPLAGKPIDTRFIASIYVE